MPAELKLPPEHAIETEIGRTVALAATIKAKGIQEYQAGGIRPETIQEAGSLTEQLYWLRHKVLASGKSPSDFETVARAEGMRMLHKYCNGASDSVLEILVDAELEFLDRVVAAEARIN